MHGQDCPCLPLTHGAQAPTATAHGTAQMLSKLKEKLTGFLNVPSYHHPHTNGKDVPSSSVIKHFMVWSVVMLGQSLLEALLGPVPRDSPTIGRETTLHLQTRMVRSYLSDCDLLHYRPITLDRTSVTQANKKGKEVSHLYTLQSDSATWDSKTGATPSALEASLDLESTNSSVGTKKSPLPPSPSLLPTA